MEAHFDFYVSPSSARGKRRERVMISGFRGREKNLIFFRRARENYHSHFCTFLLLLFFFLLSFRSSFFNEPCNDRSWCQLGVWSVRFGVVLFLFFSGVILLQKWLLLLCFTVGFVVSLFVVAWSCCFACWGWCCCCFYVYPMLFFLPFLDLHCFFFSPL